MTANEVSEKYIAYLEHGDVDSIIKLFTPNGIVDSPIYGIKKAEVFYNELKNDTSNSKLKLKGVFQNTNTNEFAIYFNYTWTLKNNEIVIFDVVDIIELNAENKIKTLKIIYDTVAARALVNKL